MSAMFARTIVIAMLLGAIPPTFGQDPPSGRPREQVSSERAVELAERFVRENGYTDAPDSVIKAQLDQESIEWTNDRAEAIEARRNTLLPKAIGVKAANGEWGVAFDRVSHPGTCRVVTMRKDGTRMKLQHQDGIRGSWIGFEQR